MTGADIREAPSWWRWACGLCAVTMLLLSLLPMEPQTLTTGWDKSNHLLGFLVLGVLAVRAYPGRLVAVVLALLVLGGVIEGLQSLTVYRQAEWADWVADALGTALGCGLGWWWQRVSA